MRRASDFGRWLPGIIRSSANSWRQIDDAVFSTFRRWFQRHHDGREYLLTTAERLIVTGITARSELIRREIARLAKPLDDDSLLFREMVAARTGLTVEEIDTAWEFRIGDDGTGAKLVRKVEAATETESVASPDLTTP
jgi:hypothetical protein